MLDLIGMQMQSIRALIDALAQQTAALEQALQRLSVATVGPPDAGAGGCPHPDDQRTPANNLGEPPAFLCGRCKQIVQDA